jgi:hypothetical protein
MIAAGWVIRRTGKTGGSQPIMLLLTVCAINSVVMREQKRELCLLPVKTSAKSLTLGGEGGIRTLDTLARIPVFETGTFNHSATSPIIQRCE